MLKQKQLNKKLHSAGSHGKWTKEMCLLFIEFVSEIHKPNGFF